ncbi:lysozyme g-like 1 [Chanos chanos]|uniref:Lysozyme g n=1 Tax=Chanos chanos TaxID=29144 RepID=A0A6J2X1G3_CHACN|nr:lysozyme g-like [Chanos chanos]
MGAPLIVYMSIMYMLHISTCTCSSCIYGDVTKIDTTGASESTARQDKLRVKGVEASHELAEHDLRRMNKYKSIIIRVGGALQMDPAVIAAIISRESRAGAALVDGWGDHGNGFGLMQVDKRYHKLRGAWDSEEHVTQGTEILIDSIKAIQRKFPNWPKEHQFKGGISAYNAGVRNVRTYERMDIGTTGNDYSNDVVARAQWYKRNGY